MRSYHRPLIGSTLWRRGRLVLLGALLFAIIGAGLWWIQDDFRGGDSPEEVAARYVTAMKRGDAFAVLWLMHPDREDRSPVAGRIERYRGVGDDELEIEVVPHSAAAYLAGARIKVDGEPFDEIVIQNLGIGARRAKWFLVHFSESSTP